MIITWDHKITNRIRAWGKPHYDLWYALAVQLFYVYLVVWIAFGFLGWLNWWTMPIVAFTAWIITITTQAIVRRERPKFEQTTGYKMWWRTYSLPSGHATISSALATVILLQSHFPSFAILVIVALTFLVVEILIGLGRMVVGVHFLADVLSGFVLGLAFGVVYGLLL